MLFTSFPLKRRGTAILDHGVVHFHLELTQSWMFGIINRKLSEVFFEKKSSGKIECLGFCYVKKSEYKSRRERGYIQEDTKRLKLRWK